MADYRRKTKARGPSKLSSRPQTAFRWWLLRYNVDGSGGESGVLREFSRPKHHRLPVLEYGCLFYERGLLSLPFRFLRPLLSHSRHRRAFHHRKRLQDLLYSSNLPSVPRSCPNVRELLYLHLVRLELDRCDANYDFLDSCTDPLTRIRFRRGCRDLNVHQILPVHPHDHEVPPLHVHFRRARLLHGLTDEQHHKAWDFLFQLRYLRHVLCPLLSSNRCGARWVFWRSLRARNVRQNVSVRLGKWSVHIRRNVLSDTQCTGVQLL